MAKDYRIMIKIVQLISRPQKALLLTTFFIFSAVGCQKLPNEDIVTIETSTVDVQNNELGSAALKETPLTNKSEMETMEFEYKNWLDTVFNDAGTGIKLASASPLLPPEAVGAKAAIGYAAQDPELWISVYQFESNALHEQAIQELGKNLPFEEAITGAGGNGVLLIFGYATPTGDALYDEFHPLNDLLSAFAGEE